MSGAEDEQAHAADAGLATAEQVARYFALRTETIELWARQGHIPQVADGVFDIEQLEGVIRRAAREAKP